jgi:hypothetical protein
MSARHWISVEQRREEYDAACRCGWESTGHEDRDSADAAGDEHLAAFPTGGSPCIGSTAP